MRANATVNIVPGNSGHHLYYGLSVDLKKSFFNLNIHTRTNELLKGSPQEREEKVNRICSETCCTVFVHRAGLKMEKQFFDDTDLKNLDSICQFLYNIVTPEQNQTVCLLEIDVWNQVNDLLEKLETYTNWAQYDNTYRLFRYFKFDIEQLQKLVEDIPRPNNTKSARKA